MAIFNSYVSLPEGISPRNDAVLPRLIVWIPTVDETPIFHRPQVLLLVLSPILISRHWPYPHHLCFHLFGGGNKDWGSQSHNGFLVTGPMTWNFLGILRNPHFPETQPAHSSHSLVLAEDLPNLADCSWEYWTSNSHMEINPVSRNNRDVTRD